MKSLILLFLAFPVISWSQIYKNFESGTLESWKQSRDSAWCLTTIDALSGSYSLWHRLDDSLNGEDRISFAYDSLVINGSMTTWQFSLKHSYLPSSSNKWAVFILSDRDEQQMRPGGSVNAVVLGVNFRGSDDILKLWRMRNGELEILAVCDLNWQEEIGTSIGRLQVERGPSGEWKVFIATGTGLNLNPGGDEKNGWQLIGQGSDILEISPTYFGIYYRFSSKQDRKLWLDDIFVHGTFIKDTTPPFIIDLDVPDANTLRLEFSESLDQERAMNEEQYSISYEGREPDSVIFQSPTTILLVFTRPFPSGVTQTLKITGIVDRKGNVSDFLDEEFLWYAPGPGDIIINEIMYDPEPVIKLPGYEYIELYNRTDYTIRMEGWMIRTGLKSIILPDVEFPLRSYMLLCYKGSLENYREASLAIDVLGSRTIFLNEGSTVYLSDRDSSLIDWMEYGPKMHTNEYYASGGWSLERIDPERDCYAPVNWTSSKDRSGGSPGSQNSVIAKNPDRDAPMIQSVFITDTINLHVVFNKTMSWQSLLLNSEWRLTEGSASDINGSVRNPDTIDVNHPFCRELRLVYQDGFEPGRDYYLEPGPGIEDCSGNSIGDGTRCRIAVPLIPGNSEILISEILFNPMPFCPDYVEIYNPGPSTFDLADIGLASRDPLTSEITSAVRIMAGHRLFFPGEYLVLTSDPEALIGCYSVNDPDVLIKTRDIPGMADDMGSILIIDKYQKVIDEFTYDNNMHHEGLQTGEGVALERISFFSSSENRSNWHSASSNDGFGTPGRQNSQFNEARILNEGFELEPEIFSPNLDGVNDMLLIKYCFNSPGMTARILVFDSRGRLIKDIAGKQLLGTEGFFTWDGTDRNGLIARSGIYLVIAEINGKEEGYRNFKMTCVLSRGR